MKNEDLVPLFIPALSALLVNAEDKKGSPLDKEEVLSIRDRAAVIMVTKEHVEKMVESRGYADIDPENCWYDWQMLRREMGRKPNIDPGARFSYVPRDDDEFRKTVIAAQDTLNEFRHLLVVHPKEKVFPLVKILLAEPSYRAYMWLLVRSHNGSEFVGEIFELPSEFTQYSVGQQLNVSDGEVQDWMLNDSGTLYGGYSLRYSRAKLSEEEKVAFDKHVGVVVYA